MSRKFTVIDESFVCSVCGANVPVLGYTARDHCRVCLCSLHLDNNPGDRQSECGGILRPVGVERKKKGLQILYKCDKCKTIKKNVAAEDDDYDSIIALSSKGIYSS